MSVFSLPALSVGRDPDGLPERIRIPGGAPRRVALVVGGERVGWVEPDGHVLVGDVNVLQPASTPARMLTLLKHGDARFRAVIHNGEVAAVVAVRR